MPKFSAALRAASAFASSAFLFFKAAAVVGALVDFAFVAAFPFPVDLVALAVLAGLEAVEAGVETVEVGLEVDLDL